MNALTSITAAEDRAEVKRALGGRMADPWWRLTSGALYKIMTKDSPLEEGAVIPFYNVR